jgi:hypothetical protein
MAPAPPPTPVTERRGTGTLPYVVAAAVVAALYVRDLHFANTGPSTTPSSIADDAARLPSTLSVADDAARSPSSSSPSDGPSQELHHLPDLLEDEEGLTEGARDLRFSFCRS